MATWTGTWNKAKSLDVELRSDWGENGFENSTDSTLAWTDSTPDRTLSVQPVSSSFNYFIDGTKYTSTGDTVQITDVEGIHVIYYDGAVLTALANPNSDDVDSVIRTKAIVSIVYWDVSGSTAIYVGEERHGKVMSPSSHAYHHFKDGLVFLNGLGLNTMSVDGAGSNADCQFGIDAGAVTDEDIYHPISAVLSTTGLPIYYMLGASAEWQKHIEAGFPVRTLDATSTTRLCYNQFTGGAWQLTDVGNNDFVLCHVFATTEKDSPMIAVMGQEKYLTRRAAREGAKTEIKQLVTNDILFPEIRAIATIIYQTNTGYASSVNGKVVSTDDGDDYVDWRDELISRTEISTSDHGSLSGLSSDDHIQYTLLDGRSTGQTVIGGTDSGDDLSLQSTSNATKGDIAFGSGTDQMFYSETLKALAIGNNEHQNVVNGATFTGKFATWIDNGDLATAGIGFERAENTLAGFGAIIYGGRSRGTIAARTIVQDNDSLMSIIAVGRDGTDYAIAGSIDFEVDGTPGNDDMPTRIVFNTSADGSDTPTERAKIDSSGKMFINGLYANGLVSGERDIKVAATGELRADTSTKATKTNIKKVDLKDASKLYSLKVKSYEFKQEDGKGSGDAQYGVIADDVEKVENDLCVYDDNGELATVKHNSIMYLTLKLVQEQRTEIDELKKRIKKLEKILK